MDYVQAHTVGGLDVELFEIVTEKLATIFKVDFGKQRLGSVHFHSKMRHLGRTCLFTRTTKKLQLNLKKQHRVFCMIS